MSRVLAIIGAGPRGISVLERIAASVNEDSPPLEIHLIDDAQIGAGRIWDTEQTRTLCMNTLAGAVTLFTEPGSSVTAPVLEGPMQYEWIRLLRGDATAREEIAPAKLALFDTYPPHPSIAADFATELAATVEQSNPSRALYGAYLRWVYEVVLQRLPSTVTVVEHRQRAVAITPAGTTDLIGLANGTTLHAHQTVLATGWTAPGPTATEQAFADSGLPWIRPDNPVEQNTDLLAPGETALVRGLGMGFFDLMALVTIDRGGEFVEDPTSRSGLRYLPSGQEPQLVVASGRGYPYLPKSDFGGLPPAARLPRLRAAIARLSDAERIDYDTQVWPAVVRDAYDAYYRVLSRVRPEAVLSSYEEILRVIDSAENIDQELAAHTTEPFNLAAWIDPLAGVHGDVDTLTAHIADSMARDISEAAAGLDSPLKAALWSVSASRKPSQILGAQGRMTWESRANTYATMMALGQMAGSGPPLFRTRQLLALVDAGLVRFLGAAPAVTPTADGWEATSASSEESLRASVLADAFMHSPDLRRPSDSLFTSLGSRISTFGPTGSPQVDPATRRIVHQDGSVDERVHVIGIPTHGQLPDTTISPMPGTDSLMLRETDATARDVLR